MMCPQEKELTMTKSIPMQSIFWTQHSHFLKRMSLLLGGVVVLALASQLSIPLQPVPLTFQSATVILIGMAYGPRYGASVVAAYLLAGACGLPVFANFSFGIDKFFGPTGGYLIGFLPAAWFSGYLAQKGFAKNIFLSFMTACLGASVIFLLGVTQLASLMGWHQALMLGVAPFIISETIKLLCVACVIPKLWKPAA